MKIQVAHPFDPETPPSRIIPPTAIDIDIDMQAQDLYNNTMYCSAV